MRRLVLNRPELLNAIDIHLADALLSCLDAGRRDSGVRCLVLTGAG
ncbi:enoyl-CoA hydratase/isomerase family protein [Nocardia jiangxiensis]|nr:enoyl-CoA hydratase/isomerase family protein [Nocardia jiangxiensis]